MRNIWEHKTAIFLTVATLVIAILIGIFAAVASGEKASVAEDAVGIVAEPGQVATGGVGGWIGNMLNYFGSVKSLKAENEALKHSNVELDRKVRELQGMEEENNELRAMLNLTETEPKLDLMAVQVIAKDPSNWYSSFTINKGSKDGIQKKQPVFTANQELVGQVYRVGSTWAEVITILDPESGVGAMLSRSGDIGVIEGNSSLRYLGQCQLGYLSRDVDISVGDYVETSGMGGIYPKGLVIGKVAEVKEDNATMSKYATVEPLADFSKLSHVFVLKSYTEELKKVEMKDREESPKETEKPKDDDDEESRESRETEKPKATQRPTVTPKPTSTKKPTATPKPVATAAPAATQKPQGTSQAMTGSELQD